uniref:Uncharacterized protein n=1 Tax=Oryza nivara TaxID=4536 RepID=A0A0E0FUX6_ORYNI
MEAGLAREARPAVEEATSARGRSCRWMCAVFVARRLAGGGCRCSDPTWRQRLSGGGLLRSVTLSGSRSGASLLPGLCVGTVGVWVAVYFFFFPGYDPPGL